MALRITGLSECLRALSQHLREFCTWTSIIGSVQSLRLVDSCLFTSSTRHKTSADVIFDSLIDYQLLCTKITFNVRRIERNFLLSPMTTALLMHGNWDFTSSSIKTGAMFSPPAVIISSYKNTQELYMCNTINLQICNNKTILDWSSLFLKKIDGRSDLWQH